MVVYELFLIWSLGGFYGGVGVVYGIRVVVLEYESVEVIDVVVLLY